MSVSSVNAARAIAAYNAAKEMNANKLRQTQEQIAQENIQLETAQRMVMENAIYPHLGNNIDVYA